MKPRSAALILISGAVFAGCQDSPVNPDRTVQVGVPMLEKGGIPGPPPDLVIPRPPGVPPRPPVPLPPNAQPPSFLSNIIDIGAGNDFSCALRSDFVVLCWGANGSGQLGDGSQAPSIVPREVSGPTRFARIFVGDLHVCGLTAAGAAYCWGNNNRGQLGIGLAQPLSPLPVAVSGGLTFTELAVGLSSVCGIATNGATYCWGDNANRQLGTGSTAAAIGAPTLVLNSASLGLVSISSGFLGTCGLTSLGAMYCWGADAIMFGNGSAGGSPPTQDPVRAASPLTFASVAVGNIYTCGIDNGGRATCWGRQFTGELGIGSSMPAVTTPAVVGDGRTFSALDAFNNNLIFETTCGLTPSGEAWCWGSNRVGQLGAPSNDTCSAANINLSCSLTPVQVTGGIVFEKIAVGSEHVCAISGDNVAWCWGSNDMGQLGDGSLTNSPTPIRVRDLQIPRQIGSIVVTPATALVRLLEGTQQFTAQALDENGTPLTTQPTFLFTSSNSAVATVDGSGLATAWSNGQAIITAAADGKTGSAVLDVDIIDPAVAFRRAWSGFNVNNGSDGVVVLGGLLGDEWGSSDTFITRYDVDRRTISNDNLTIQAAYDALVFARTALEFEVARLLRRTPSDARLGQMRALDGYIHIAFAENFCSGVPLTNPNVGKTTNELFADAVALFDAAIAGPIAEPYATLAKVGKARALVGLGNFPAAATIASTVPTAFMFGTTHSTIAGEQNSVYVLNTQARRLTLSDAEGTNGLFFRSNDDPRVPWVPSGIGFNGVTPLYLLTKYTATSPLTFASGIEARLIEAEAALNASDPNGYFVKINEAAATIGLKLAIPQNPSEQIDQLFYERAAWLFASGSRLGDLRRLVRLYGRAQSEVFPVGPYPFLGGSYGTDANLPVPASARGSGFTGCTDRTS